MSVGIPRPSSSTVILFSRLMVTLIWFAKPASASSMELFDLAIKDQVAFVPGDPFYVNREDPANTFRLNFSCADEPMILKGIERLGRAIKSMELGTG